MNVVKDLKYILKIYREMGANEAWATLLSGIKHIGSTCHILVALENPQPIEKAFRASEGHEFKFASPDDLRKLKELPEYEISQVDVDRVENKIARCLLHIDGDIVTGYAWVWNSSLAYIDDGFYLNLPSHAIYNYKALTLPEYRGLGFQGLRHLKLLELLKDEGIENLFGFVNHLNRKSLHGVQKSGYRPIGELQIKKKNGNVLTNLKVDKKFWPGLPVDQLSY